MQNTDANPGKTSPTLVDEVSRELMKDDLYAGLESEASGEQGVVPQADPTLSPKPDAHDALADALMHDDAYASLEDERLTPSVEPVVYGNSLKPSDEDERADALMCDEAYADLKSEDVLSPMEDPSMTVHQVEPDMSAVREDDHEHMAANVGLEHESKEPFGGKEVASAIDEEIGVERMISFAPVQGGENSLKNDIGLDEAGVTEKKSCAPAPADAEKCDESVELGSEQLAQLKTMLDDPSSQGLQGMNTEEVDKLRAMLEAYANQDIEDEAVGSDGAGMLESLRKYWAGIASFRMFKESKGKAFGSALREKLVDTKAKALGGFRSEQGKGSSVGKARLQHFISKFTVGRPWRMKKKAMQADGEGRHGETQNTVKPPKEATKSLLRRPWFIVALLLLLLMSFFIFTAGKKVFLKQEDFWVKDNYVLLLMNTLASLQGSYDLTVQAWGSFQEGGGQSSALSQLQQQYDSLKIEVDTLKSSLNDLEQLSVMHQGWVGELTEEQLAAEQLAAEQLVAEQLAAEQLAAEQLAAEQLAAEQLAAEQLAAEQLAAEQLAAEQLVVESRRRWAVNIVSLSSQARADAEVNRLQKASVKAVISPVMVHGRKLFRVYVPGFISSKAAQVELARLKASSLIKQGWVGEAIVLDKVATAVPEHVPALWAEQSGRVKQIANLRQGPGRSFDVLGHAKRGALVQSLEQSNGWSKVQMAVSGRIGWIHQSLLIHDAEMMVVDKILVLSPTAAVEQVPKAEPTKAEPTKAEPTKAEPAKAEPTKAEPGDVTWVVNVLSLLNQQMHITGFPTREEAEAELARLERAALIKEGWVTQSRTE